MGRESVTDNRSTFDIISGQAAEILSARQAVFGAIGNLAITPKGKITYFHDSLGLVRPDFTQFCFPEDNRAVAVMGSLCSAAGAFVYNSKGDFNRRETDGQTISFIPRPGLVSFKEHLREKQTSRSKDSGLQYIRLLGYILDHTRPYKPAGP